MGLKLSLAFLPDDVAQTTITTAEQKFRDFHGEDACNDFVFDTEHKLIYATPNAYGTHRGFIQSAVADSVDAYDHNALHTHGVQWRL